MNRRKREETLEKEKIWKEQWEKVKKKNEKEKELNDQRGNEKREIVDSKGKSIR
jgi:hypothetical protein